MEYIYSRVSTDKQDNQNQLIHLTQRYPNAQIREEIASGAKNRPILNQLLSELKDGDTLIVAALDRLGRKTLQALILIEDLYSRGIKVVSVREGLDYSTPSGKMVSQIMFSVAEMERSLIIGRIKSALAAKKAQGVKLGRPKECHIVIVATLKAHRANGLTYRQIW